MALKSQCFLPDGTAHTQGLRDLPSFQQPLSAPRKPKIPEKSTQAQQVLLCWTALELITKRPLSLLQTLLHTKTKVQIAACTPQPSERQRQGSDFVFIFISQNKIKREEPYKCKEHGAMVTSDIRSLTEQTSCRNDFCINRITQLC